jgi:TolB-like protein
VLYHFETFALDTERRELRRAGRPVPVEPKVFDLLVHVITNRERVVSKDDLIAAVWKGRIVSESAMTTCINAARTAVGDSGEAQRLIKTLARKGIRFVGTVREEQKSPVEAIQVPPETSQIVLVLPDRPSVAVLPFMNLSADPEQEYFADGIVEDIITALSRMRWLFVIARNSSFTYKGRSVDLKQVGRELGVRYLLEGSVRKSARRVRITAQLVDVSTGASLAAQRFEGTLNDIFELQDQVTASVIGALLPSLEKAEIARAKRKPTESLDAYDLYLRGMSLVYRWTKDSHDEALRLFYRVMELEPDFASAYGMAARCYAFRTANGWMTDPAMDADEVGRLCRRVIEVGQDDAVALCTAGHALSRVVGDTDAGSRLIDRALELNPNLGAAWFSGGWVNVWRSEPSEGITRFLRAMRLSPVDPQMFNMQAGVAAAHFIACRYDEACLWAALALKDQPGFGSALRIATASHALAGRQHEAQEFFVRLRKTDPGLRAANIKDRVVYRQPEDNARLLEGLRKAGLAE